jgi:DNA-binding GntR family transcriptional regulator
MAKKSIPLTVDAYNTIKQKIIDFHLRPGEIILAQSLANDLGISRTPVREALVRLTQEGLVEHADGRKFRITEITLESIKEIYEVRESLEVVAVYDLAQKIDEPGLARIGESLEEMRKALDNHNVDNFFNLDLDFHSIIVDLHGNKTMAKILDQLHDKIQRIRYLTVNIEGRVQNTIDEHEIIYNALKDHDGKAAVDAIRSHFGKVKNDFEKLASESNGKAYLWKTLMAF